MKLQTYLTALGVFFALDMLWLGVIARKFYRTQIGFLLRDDTLWPAAIAFYLIFVAALVHFVIVPGIERRSLSAILLNGAFFGFATYAAYDLTNLAVTRDWPLSVTIVDLLWGAFLGACVSGVTLKIFQSYSLGSD